MSFDAMGLMGDYAALRSLVAAMRTGLWESVAEQPRTIGGLAAEHGLADEAIRRIFDVLEAKDWVSVADGRWAARDGLAEAFNSLPESLATYADGFEDLEVFLRSGAPIRQGGGKGGYSEVVERLAAMFRRAARELARNLEFGPETALDLGAGAGVFGLAVAEHHPLEKLVGFDRPDVAEVFEQNAVDAGFGAIAEPMGGDFLNSDLPGGFDCVLVCNVLRILEEDDARRLLKRVAGCLGDGGRAVVVDVIGDDPESFWLSRAVYRLDLATRHRSGGPHDERLLRQWYRDAGLELADEFRLEKAPLGEMAHVLVESAS